MERVTEEEARHVVMQFFDLNANRAPVKAFEDIVDCENLEIVLEGTDVAFHGIAGFADHQIGKLIFFDQRFELDSIKTENDDQGNAVLRTTGVWYASTWQSPAAQSHQLIADLEHTWTIVRNERSGQAVLRRQICERLEYRAGHAPQAVPLEFHLRVGQDGH